MTRKELPEFKPPAAAEMRELWKMYPDEDIRRVLMEVEHLRRILERIEAQRLVIARAYRDQNMEQMIALENLRNLLRAEKQRLIGAKTGPDTIGST